MKIRFLKKSITGLLSGAVLAAIAYSLLALDAQPAYASACNNCGAEEFEAEVFCADNNWGDRVEGFICPYLGSAYTFQCVGDPQHRNFTDPCDE